MRTFNAKISGGDGAQDSRGRFRLCPSLCTSFVRNSNSEVGRLVLGIKYPQPKFSAESAQGGLHPDSYRSRVSSPTSTTGKIRPGSYGSRTSHLTFIAGGLRPDSYGNRAPIATSTPGGLCPDSYGSRAPPTTPTSRGALLGLLREPGFVANVNRR